MPDPRPVNPVVKQVLELGPTLVFFLLYIWIKDETYVIGGTAYSGFIVATVVFVPLMVAAMLILRRLSGRLSRIQVFTLFMVVFFGALTAWFNDERFFMMKTSIVYGIMATILLVGWLTGRNWLQWVLAEMLPMKPEGWNKLLVRVIAMFYAMAALNELIWRTQPEATWVTIETFVFPVILFAFFWLQIISLGRYLTLDQDKAAK
jgi:intracellular septation protein